MGNNLIIFKTEIVKIFNSQRNLNSVFMTFLKFSLHGIFLANFRHHHPNSTDILQQPYRISKPSKNISS